MISITSQAIQLNSAHLQLLLSLQRQISATLSFLDQSIAWIDIDIDTLQISFVSSLQTKVDTMSTLLLALQSGGGNSTSQLSTSETTALVAVISNLTSLLQGYVQAIENCIMLIKKSCGTVYIFGKASFLNFFIPIQQII